MKCPQEELPLNEATQESVARALVDLYKLNGALYCYPGEGGDYVDHVPFAVLPYEVLV